MMNRKKLLLWVLIAALSQGAIAAITNSNPHFYGLFGSKSVNGEHRIYFGYAEKAMSGQVPYRDFQIEYPLLGFVVLFIPRLFTSNFRFYQQLFGAEMLIFNAATLYLVARFVERDQGIEKVPGRLIWYTLFFAGMCPLSMGRYDLAPMALAFASSYFWFSNRNVTGGVLCGLGILMKIFPGAIGAPALVFESFRFRESRGRGLIACVVTTVLGVLVWGAFAGSGLIESVQYHMKRGLEVESLYAGVIFAVGKIQGEEVRWVIDFGAFHVAPDWGARVASWAMPIQLALIGLVMCCYYVTGMRDGIRYAGASILAFMIAGKVLSPQFMIWLFPFVAILGGDSGRRARFVFFMSCVSTTAIYPLGGLYFLLEGEDIGIFFLNLRNFLLVVLFLIMISESTGSRIETESAALQI